LYEPACIDAAAKIQDHLVRTEDSAQEEAAERELTGQEADAFVDRALSGPHHTGTSTKRAPIGFTETLHSIGRRRKAPSLGAARVWLRAGRSTTPSRWRRWPY
jgi:hypothetical protein